MATNKYPTNCARCNARLAAGAGRLAGKVGKTWLVECTGHAVATRAEGRRDSDDGYDALKDGALVNGSRW